MREGSQREEESLIKSSSQPLWEGRMPTESCFFRHGYTTIYGSRQSTVNRTCRFVCVRTCTVRERVGVGVRSMLRDRLRKSREGQKKIDDERDE